MAKSFPSAAARMVASKWIVPTTSPAEGSLAGEGVGPGVIVLEGVGDGATGLARPRGRTRIRTRMARAATPTAMARAVTRPHGDRGGGSPGSRVRTSGHRSGAAIRSAGWNRVRRSGITFLQERPEAAAPPGEVHAHGRGRRVQDCGCLFDRVPAVIAKDDRPSLLRRKRLERGREVRSFVSHLIRALRRYRGGPSA